MKTERMMLPIEDLGCGGGGTLAIERALEKLPGVIRASVNPLTEMAYVEYDPALMNWDALRGAIERVGFRIGTSSIR